MSCWWLPSSARVRSRRPHAARPRTRWPALARRPTSSSTPPVARARGNQGRDAGPFSRRGPVAVSLTPRPYDPPSLERPTRAPRSQSRGGAARTRAAPRRDRGRADGRLRRRPDRSLRPSPPPKRKPSRWPRSSCRGAAPASASPSRRRLSRRPSHRAVHDLMALPSDGSRSQSPTVSALIHGWPRRAGARVRGARYRAPRLFLDQILSEPRLISGSAAGARPLRHATGSACRTRPSIRWALAQIEEIVRCGRCFPRQRPIWTAWTHWMLSRALSR